jgi:hypothetical protein
VVRREAPSRVVPSSQAEQGVERRNLMAVNPLLDGATLARSGRSRCCRVPTLHLGQTLVDQWPRRSTGYTGSVSLPATGRHGHNLFGRASRWPVQ